MQRLLTVLLVAVTLPGCFLVFDEHGKGGGDDDCLLPPAEDQPLPGPRTSPVAPQRNPVTLSCQVVGGGGTCNPDCGPCPETALAPIPSWGFCFSACESLDEATCAEDPTCRVIKDAECAISGSCLTDFLGCVATDQFTDAQVNCTAVTDGDSCSRNPACTAYHVSGGCSILTNDESCVTEFAFCGPEGRGAGRCFDQAACDRTPPVCPAGTTPGVADGCFTDVCIPNSLCEPAPGA